MKKSTLYSIYYTSTSNVCRVREDEVVDQVSPVVGVEEFEVDVVNDCFWNRDERPIEDDARDDGDCCVPEPARE